VGLEYYAVSNSSKRYCRLGKRTVCGSFQIPYEAFAAFLIEEYQEDNLVRIINDAMETFDDIHEEGWTECSGSYIFWGA